MILGTQADYKEGILECIELEASIGANAFQLFLGSSHSSSIKDKLKITSEEASIIKRKLKNTKMTLIIHSVYVINFCNHPASSGRIKYAHENIIYDLEFCERIGGYGVVVHFGSSRGLSLQTAIDNMADNIAYILNKTQNTIKHSKLILETSAGQGAHIGSSIPEIGHILNAIKERLHPPTNIHQLGICIDTAHIFASGYDIREPTGIQNYIKTLEEAIAPFKIAMFHLNDSAATLNQRRDIHRPITKGTIFSHPSTISTLSHLLQYSSQHKIPVILETQGGARPPATEYKNEIEMLNTIKNSKFISQSKMKLSKFSKLSKSSIKHFKKTIKTKVLKTLKNLKTVKQLKNLNYNKKIIEILELLKQYYKHTKDNIRVNAYERAIYQIKKYKTEIQNGNEIKKLEGIGKKMIDKIDEIIKTGSLTILEEPKIKEFIEKIKNGDVNSLNPDKLENIYGIGNVIAHQFRKHGINNPTDLEYANKIGKIQLNAQQILGLKYRQDLSQLIPRQEALFIKEQISKSLKASTSKEISNIEVVIAGSYPSGKEASKDIDLIFKTHDITSLRELEKSNLLSECINTLIGSEIIAADEVFNVGYTKFLGLVISHYNKSDGEIGIRRHVDIRLIPETYFIPAYFYYTSGREFNKIIREKAKRKGLKLNEWGLTDIITGKEILVKTEKDIFEKIGVSFIPLNERR